MLLPACVRPIQQLRLARAQRDDRRQQIAADERDGGQENNRIHGLVYFAAGTNCGREAGAVTCASIRRYVFVRPASSEIAGSQPSTSRSRWLSLLRPRTPCGFV